MRDDTMADPSARLVRKSAYGRTQLFLPSPTAVLREVKCMGGMTKKDAASVYHVLPPAHETGAPVACWHCCEAVGDSAVPIPRYYDSGERVYHVYGTTCCPGCAKAYILEHTTFDRGHHLNVLVKMLREVYGVAQPVVETPPRPALKRFGGAFDPTTQPKAACRLVEPPFVSYTMIVEERVGQAPVEIAEEAESLQEPPPPGLYADFVRAQQSVAPLPTTKRPRSDPAPGTGPMSRFVKKQATGAKK